MDDSGPERFPCAGNGNERVERDDEQIEVTSTDDIKNHKRELTLEGMRHFFVAVERGWKFDTLCELYYKFKITLAVIFCNTEQKVDWLATKMKESNFTVVLMDGESIKKDRAAVMEEIRSGGNCAVIVTDTVECSWLRLEQWLINYDLPDNRESYIQRIGQECRFGKKGVAVNLVGRDDVGMMRDIEQYYSIYFDPIPSDWV